MPPKNLASLCLLVVLLFALSGKSAWADDRYVFDKAHTTISFSVSRLGIFDVDGVFGAYDGDFVFNAGEPDKAAIAITLYSAGIRSADKETDDELQGPDFFNAAQFPEMRFVSRSVNLIDDGHATISGDLTLLGVTKIVTFDATFTEQEGDDGYVVGFSATGTIQRSDFGMGYLIPIIGDDVHLDIQVRGVKEKQAPKKNGRRSSTDHPS